MASVWPTYVRPVSLTDFIHVNHSDDLGSSQRGLVHKAKELGIRAIPVKLGQAAPQATHLEDPSACTFGTKRLPTRPVKR